MTLYGIELKVPPIKTTERLLMKYENDLEPSPQNNQPLKEDLLGNNMKPWKKRFREFCRQKGIGGLAYLNLIPFIEELLLEADEAGRKVGEYNGRIEGIEMGREELF